jgi:hypothetical protein
LARQTRFERPVSVDDRSVEIVNRAANDAGVELLDDEVLRIGGYVLRGRQDSRLGLELDKALGLEHAQGAALVAWIVRHADHRAAWQIGQAVMLFRIEPDRPDGGEADRNDVVAARLDLVVEVGFVLKRIGALLTIPGRETSPAGRRLSLCVRPRTVQDPRPTLRG